ncbi:MAG TPA: hypothetical protein VK694_01395 [Verrucomicrobiae bacterium]|nr:hypothetical protein [Verrucomicrobiae bacterium]
MTTSTISRQTVPINTDHLHSVEFFHVYTDDDIDGIQTNSLEQLGALKQMMGSKAQPIILIDNYNPTAHTLGPDDIFRFLEEREALPAYWAYEADLVANAGELLDNITDRRLAKSYRRYVEAHDKFPCSLLTAAWYLTRLGALDSRGVIRKVRLDEPEYAPVDSLINILPEMYHGVEERACKIIVESEYAQFAPKIRYILYQTEQFEKPNAY